jgi:hypothetical protein
LLLGHRGAYDMNAFLGHWIYWLTNRVHSFSSINHFKFKYAITTFIWYIWIKINKLLDKFCSCLSFLFDLNLQARRNNLA